MTTHMQTLPGDARAAQTPKTTRVAIAITTGVVASTMALSGVLYLVAPPPVVAAMHELGYPPYFFKLLGLAKILGAAALVAPVPRTVREWAYAGFTFDLLAAIVSHAATTGATHVLQPLVVVAVLAVSYVLRQRAANDGRGQPNPSQKEANVMFSPSRRSLFARAVVVVGSLLFVRIGLEYLVDPIGAVARTHQTLGSPDAITATRCAGGIFLALAAVFIASAVWLRYLLPGLISFFMVTATILGVRVLGLAIDGPGPFTLMVLKPEIVLVIASGVALALVHKSLRNAVTHADAAATPRSERVGQA